MSVASPEPRAMNITRRRMNARMSTSLYFRILLNQSPESARIHDEDIALL